MTTLHWRQRHTLFAFTLAAASFASTAAAGDTHHVAATLDDDDEAVFSDQRASVRDHLSTMHGLSLTAAMARDSELAHPDYRPELADGMREEQAETWLALLDTFSDALGASGAGPAPYWQLDAKGNSEAEGEPQIADLGHAIYLYHMHHRGGRFEDLGLDTRIHFQGAAALGQLTRDLMDAIAAIESPETVSERKDFNHQLGAFHGPAYAWARWDKDEDAEDMRAVPAERLGELLGVDREALVTQARDFAVVLDDAWDEELQAYTFGADSAEYDLIELGALMRGHKGVYEALARFGDSDDREVARTLFDRQAAMLAPTLELARSWGLPADVHFDADGATAAEDVVDTAAQWRFVNELTGGFALPRERGGPEWLAERAPELDQQLGDTLDQLLLGALEHQRHEGLIVQTLDYGDGEVRNATPGSDAIGMFVAAAGNAYGIGDAFPAPGNWDGGSGEEQTRALFDAMVAHSEVLTNRFVIAPERGEH